MRLTHFEIFIIGPLLVQNFWVILLSNYDESRMHIFRDLYNILSQHFDYY